MFDRFWGLALKGLKYGNINIIISKKNKGYIPTDNSSMLSDHQVDMERKRSPRLWRLL